MQDRHIVDTALHSAEYVCLRHNLWTWPSNLAPSPFTACSISTIMISDSSSIVSPSFMPWPLLLFSFVISASASIRTLEQKHY